MAEAKEIGDRFPFERRVEFHSAEKPFCFSNEELDFHLETLNLSSGHFYREVTNDCTLDRLEYGLEPEPNLGITFWRIVSWSHWNLRDFGFVFELKFFGGLCQI